MSEGVQQRPKHRWFERLFRHVERWVVGLIEMLRIPAPEQPHLMRRIEIMERDIILPIKVAWIVMVLFYFYARWIHLASTDLDIAVETAQYFFWLYIGLNTATGGVLLAMNRLPPPVVQAVVYGINLVDGIFLSALTLVTEGFDSILYWLFLGLIVRSAVSVPRATSQILLNLTLTACYVLAAVVNVSVAETLDETTRVTLRLAWPLSNPTETLLLRVALLLLMTACCYGLQVLLERQRQVVEEAREFAMREGQLRSAGRLAAEFTHQMKNPLAIINNAAFSLQRALKQGKREVSEQVRIIQEEVERSDRIITQIMGYAQLSEGRVEKLSVIEELDGAIARVFPPAADYPIRVHRDYAAGFPPLLMVRRHAADAFQNLLQNAREALDGKPGNVRVTARCHGEETIEVTIADDGPGIPADKQAKIFEAYYTTRPRGSGLGLAIVKHNVELYGGSVRVESELGKGARFTIVFPVKTQVKSTETI